MSRETPRTDAAVTVCACGRVVSEHVAQGIERSLTAAEAERDKLRKRDAEWQEKAKAWMASPEAAKRLAGYREMAEKCADLDVALDTARAEQDALRDKALRYDLDQAGILQREREAIELVDLRARVAGLEAGLQASIESVRNTLEVAYHNCYESCCGRAGHECCGNTVQTWTEADQRTMDVLGPVEISLRALLAPSSEETK